jgi:hypothetical protein
MTKKFISSSSPSATTDAIAATWEEAESSSGLAIKALFQSIDSQDALKRTLILDASGDGLPALNWDHKWLAELSALEAHAWEVLNSIDAAHATLFHQRGDLLEALDCDGDLLSELLP